MNIKDFRHCTILVLIFMAYLPLYGGTPKLKYPPIDLHFRYSMSNPGVSTEIVWEKKMKKLPKGIPSPIFSVGGKETVAEQENDTTFFVHINSMQRWSPKSPVTYAVTMAIGDQKITRSFGIHDISVHNGMLSINDTTILRKGLTENALPFSTTKTTQEWCTYFKDIKQQGFTLISLNREKMSQELMTAADFCGILVHARATQSITKVTTDNTKKSKKKNKKKKDETVQETKRLDVEYVEHPSLCMATFMQDAAVEHSDKYLEASLFKPIKDLNGEFLPDYTAMIDTTKICLADFSDISDAKDLQICLEKTLCTPGVGALLFSSIDQAKAWKDVMIVGKFDRDEWDSSMSMSMDVYLVNNSDMDIQDARFTWNFIDENGFVFSNGFDNNHRFLPHTTNFVATAFTPMAFIFPNDDVTLNIRMENSQYQRSWTHKILYPAKIRYMNEEIHRRMKEWCKRGVEETDLEYGDRVNEITKARKKKLFAYDIVTEEIGDMVKGEKFKLVRYDNDSESLNLELDKVKSFKLKVPRQEAEDFINGDELELQDAKFGLTNKGIYELAYGKIFNKRTGKYLVYENFDSEITTERILINDNLVPLELKEMAEIEDSVLQKIKKNVIQDAITQNLITNHTKIDVNAHFDTDYDEDGNTRNVYKIIFDYNVDADHSMDEDYGSGRFCIEDSHAALSMLKVISSAFEKDFSRYINPGKHMDITITGSADSSPIRGTIAYNGCYGEFHDEIYFLGSEENKITITSKDGIRQNEQLAYMRAQGVHDFLQKNLTSTRDMKVRYLHNIELPKGKGGKYRYIRVCFSFTDTF